MISNEKQNPKPGESARKNEISSERIVLVGTYKGDQLTKWPG